MTDNRFFSLFFSQVLPACPTILNTNKVAHNASWVLRWSAVYSEGRLVTFYTVWHCVVHVINDNVTCEGPWLPQNITGFMYHKRLAADTRYMFAVTAWNRWGQSLLEYDKIFSLSTDFRPTSTITFQTGESWNESARTKSRTVRISSIAREFTY